METLSRRSAWIWTAIFVALTLLQWGWFLWFQFVPLGQAQDLKSRHQELVEELVSEQQSLLTSELKQLFEEASDGMRGLVSLFEARDVVFSGAIEDEHDEPVLLLDMSDFLGLFQDLLAKSSVISQLSLGPSGRLSFVIETGSYYQAAEQIQALRFGFTERPLLDEVEISSVGKQELNAELSPVFRFLVQAQVSAEYFEYQRALAEEEKLLTE